METVPELFNVLYPFMPMTYSVGLFKEVISGAYPDNFISFNVFVLFAIFVVFTGLTLAFSIKKKAKVKRANLINQISEISEVGIASV